MASDADIRTMLIDALRPSLLEFLRQELNHVGELRAALAQSESAARRRPVEMLRPRAIASTERDGDDAPRRLERAIEDRLAGIEAQLASMKQDLDGRNQDLQRLADRLLDIVDRVERRFAFAGAALRQELLKLKPADPPASEGGGQSGV